MLYASDLMCSKWLAAACFFGICKKFFLRCPFFPQKNGVVHKKYVVSPTIFRVAAIYN